ncbi:MAG: hypothetical protein EOP45_09270 [Sphingobacteriaceae bacterium]|nr:MAG: hypothetical protein EOP45_09270 [Sphingobacteriaceae bacterium]
MEERGIKHGPVRSFFDTGAHPNIISYELFRILKFTVTSSINRILGIDGVPFAVEYKVTMFIHPWYDSEISLEMKETFWILPEECKWAPVMPNSPIDMTGLTHNSPMPMADPEYGTPSGVYVLLGFGCFARAIIGVVARTLDGTAIMETTVGNIVFGYNGENDDEQNGQIATAIEYSPEQQMDRLLERLWQQDQIGNHSKWTKEEQMVEEHFMQTHYRDKSGRFVVKIPVDENITDIGSSRAVAMKRFMFLERRFLKDSELKEAYVEQMREMIRLG